MTRDGLGGARGPDDGGNRRARWLGAGPVVLVALALAAYLILHSPVRGVITRLAGGVASCFSLCDTHGEVVIASQASALLDIAAALLVAYALSGVLRFRGLEWIVAFGLLAFAFISMPAALLGALSDLINVHLLRAPYGPLVASLPAFGTVGFLLTRGWRPPMPPFRPVPFSPLAAVMLALGAGMLLISAGIAIHHPPTGYDELGYHGPLAVFYWTDGSLSDFLSRFPGGWPLAQPGSAELWFGLLRLAGGEPLMVLGQLPFAFLGAAGVGAFGKRLGLSSRAALVASLTYLLVPIVANQSGRIDDDVVGAALVIGAAALVAAPRREWTVGRVGLIGLALGIMVVTKLALLPAAAALGVVLLWTLARNEPAPDPERTELPTETSRKRLLERGLPIAAAVGLLALAPWWLRNLVLYANPLYPTNLPLYGHGISQTLLGMKDGSHVPKAWLWPLYPLLEPTRHDSGIGAVFAAAIVPGGLIALVRARRRPLAIIAIVAVVSLPVWWLETRHEPRFLLGLFGLLIALVPFVLAGVQRRWRSWVAVLLAVAAICSTGVTLTTELAVDAGDPVDRSHFYDVRWKVAPALLALPETTGVLLDDRCGPVAFSRIYPTLGSDQGRSIARIRCGLSSAQVVAALARYQMSYVYATIDVSRSATLDARYPAGTFELVAQSTTPPKKKGGSLDRRLYRLVGAPP